MMNLMENCNSGTGTEVSGTDIRVTSQEDFVNSVYSSVDKTSALRLDQLRNEDGIVPTCKLGCCHCCRYHILINIAEIHTMVQYIKRELSKNQINGLRVRTQQWHAWDNSRPDRHPSVKIEEQEDFSTYVHCCPLLVDGACSVYPVRPVVCRTHYVSSPSSLCFATKDPESTEDPPVAITSVLTATSSFSRPIRARIEKTGLEYSRSIMLLPHWLAIEMDWDFAISQ